MEWIDVNNRLPEIDETDLWNKEKGISKTTLVFESGFIYFGQYYSISDNWAVQGRIGKINVTHWIPLPPPPNKGGEK